MCLMLRDSQEDEEEEEEGNSCKPHIMRPSALLSVRPDSGAAEILACRRHYSGERADGGKGEKSEREGEREEGK